MFFLPSFSCVIYSSLCPYSGVSERHYKDIEKSILHKRMMVKYIYILHKYIHFHIRLFFQPLHVWLLGSLYLFVYHSVSLRLSFIIISLVSEKNEYEINALMKKVSFDNITQDILFLITQDILYLIKQQQNAMLSFFNIQLKSRRCGGFTGLTFG